MAAFPNLRPRPEAQDGFILPMVLVLLVVGTLLLIPTLQFAWASVNANRVTEWKVSELYDADAGVEEAVRWLTYDGSTDNGWTAVDAGQWQRSSLDHTLNGNNVTVDIEEVATQVYKVTSVATGTGTDTTIVAYVVLEHADFSMLLDSAITSDSTINLSPNVVVNGDVRLPNEDDLAYNNGEVIGDVKTNDTEGPLAWPTAEFLMDYYMNSLADEAPYTTYPAGTTLNIPAGTSEANPYVIGPAFAQGDLTLKGDGYVSLGGTVYIAGSLVFNPTPSITLDMNQQTIFAEGDVAKQAIDIGVDITIVDSGCIIGVYDVKFLPQIQTVVEGEEEPFVLVMSVLGDTTLNPQSDFYGAVVGSVDVQVQPGNTLNWVDPEGKGINFPMGEGEVGEPGVSISVPSYVIS